MLSAAPVTFIIVGAHDALVPRAATALSLEAAWLQQQQQLLLQQLGTAGALAGATAVVAPAPASASAGAGADAPLSPSPPAAPVEASPYEPLPPEQDYELSDLPPGLGPRGGRGLVSFGDLAAATADAARQLLAALQAMQDPLPALEAQRAAAAAAMDEA